VVHRPLLVIESYGAWEKGRKVWKGWVTLVEWGVCGGPPGELGGEGVTPEWKHLVGGRVSLSQTEEGTRRLINNLDSARREKEKDHRDQRPNLRINAERT